MAEFQFGNAELAAELGTEVIGEALTNERLFGGPGSRDTYQATSRGVIFYFADLPGQGVRGSQFVPFGTPGR